MSHTIPRFAMLLCACALALVASRLPAAVVADFNPATYGMPFLNDWGKPIGYCGGSVWMTLDHYYAKVAATYPTPKPGSALGNWIAERQAESVGAENWSVYLGAAFRLPSELRWDSQTTQWNRLTAEIDAGRPVPIGLFAMSNVVWESHQVVAYGYWIGASQEKVIQIYDPNASRGDVHTLTMWPTSSIIYHSGTDRETKQPVKYRGFFVSNGYAPKRLFPLPPNSAANPRRPGKPSGKPQGKFPKIP